MTSVGSNTFLPGALQASKYKYIQYINMNNLTTITSKINIYVDASISFYLIIFV